METTKTLVHIKNYLKMKQRKNKFSQPSDR